MKDRMVDKLVREAIERLQKDNAVFCENPVAFDSIRSRIREQIENGGRGYIPKHKIGHK
jgi:hypothetical protein